MAKTFLTKEQVAMRAAGELRENELVNIGTGIPALILHYIPHELGITFHSESGAIGFDFILSDDQTDKIDYSYTLAGARFTLPAPGMSFVDMCGSFMVASSGRLDLSIIGALEVSEKGDIANWTTDPEAKTGGIGGAMDLAIGAKRLIILMTHVSPENTPKIVKKCSYPLTVKECVDTIITDAAVIDVKPEGLVLREVAPGWTPDEVQAMTEPRLIIPARVGVMLSRQGGS